MPELHRGLRGGDVRKLQRLLNARIVPSPDLAVDGVFGPKTFGAVRLFQKGREIKVDGIVGKVTWAHLLGGHTVELPPVPVKGLSGEKATPAPRQQSNEELQPLRVTVWEWSLEQKLVEIIKRVPSRLDDQAAKEFHALIQPESLAVMLALIALMALLSGGTALVIAGIILGADVVMAFAAALQIAANAANENELDDAADELAHIVITIGVVAFLGGIVRLAGKIRAARGATRRPSPVEPTRPGTTQPRQAPNTPEVGSPLPVRPPPLPNSTLIRLKGLPRTRLIQEIRHASGDPNIVLWEQVAYGDMWQAVRAGPQTAEALGVRQGDVIGYRVLEGEQIGRSSIMELAAEAIQNIAPYFDPFS